jgi:hypothetical protein
MRQMQEGEKSKELAPKIEVKASTISVRARRERAVGRYRNKRKCVGDGVQQGWVKTTARVRMSIRLKAGSMNSTKCR